MIDPRLASFAMGATFGMVLSGWPWHPRFSRYLRPARRPGPYSSSARGLPPPPPPPGTRREYLYSPATMAECGGPCFDAWDPRACDCGALWRDVVIRQPSFAELLMPAERRPATITPKPDIIPKPQPSGGRLIRGDRRPDPTYRPDWSPCSQPPNDTPSQP